ncbi:lactate 2-monooxygenase [Brevibacillus choshinensis]|uniref:L-lactate oxidase n=1 Tax=Brevibacillus choshinensis TaxID=54911 RepID=A0ABR5N5N0_BRECH|nr:alpha-hydroxy-acid oxidizing protein [Brevibacillus choshinensis]KQL45912.1 lactate 2-monooxygenase [Brevibacillus choshinensis]
MSQPAGQQLPVSYAEWESRARSVLAKGPFDYIDGGAGYEDTIRVNREAFRSWRLQPQVLRNVSKRDARVTLFGKTYPAPVMLAPISIQGIAHPLGELASARAAAALGVPFILSTVSSRPLEEVAAVMGNAPRWFQLFWPNDPDVTASLLRRAEAAGYSAIVLTVDLPVYGWRERDIRNGYNPFQVGEGIANFVTDPAFRAKLRKPPEQDWQAAISLFGSIFFHPSLSWADLPFLRLHTKLPILIKGILNMQDAELALRYGADGIVVSNHGGRQVDGEVASLDVLPDVLDIVRGRIPVLMDSGIRNGPDVIKAISLGASAILFGRPYIYGLAVAGETGVGRVIQNLFTDLDLTMANCGIRSIAEMNRTFLIRR